MRAEVEQAYQAGGAAIPVDQLIARTTGSGPEESLKSMIIKNREDALARLRAGQAKIAERRSQQQKADESSKWLAFAQGMLAPTRTGGFGESLGQTAGLLRGEAELQRGHEGERIAEEQMYAAQEADIERQFMEDELRRAQIEKQGRLGEYAQRRPVGTAYSMEHPENPSRFARVQQIWDPDVIGPNGEQGMMTTQYVDTPGEDGSIPYASSPYDLQRRSELEFQLGLEEAKAERVNNDIMAGREAFPVIEKYERLVTLMREVEKGGYGTGGWIALLQGASEWFGVNTKEVTTLGMLRHGLGQAVLLGLQNFPGQISEGERKYMEALETGLAKPLGVNMALIEDGLRVQRQRYRRGVMAAQDYGMKLDLEAMGITAERPEGLMTPGRSEMPSAAPGSTQQNPIIPGPGVPEPQIGDWVQRADGAVQQWRGR